MKNNFWEKLNKPILALAPMAGITDIAFRGMCKHFGANVIYTEFASSDALTYKSKKTFEMLKFEKSERPIVVQIFGKEPKMFQKAGKILEEMGFDGIDINFGCPAYKVVKHGGGVSLMKNPELCAELVQTLIESVNIPVSVKIRASIKLNSNAKKITRTDNHTPFINKGKNNPPPLPPLYNEGLDGGYSNCPNKVTALDLVNKIKHLPVAALMIHARSFEQPFDGAPNIQIVKDIKKIWKNILLYNGGIYSPETAKKMLDKTGADGIGIARGAWGSPWIFQQITDYLTSGAYQKPNHNEIKKYILMHAELALRQKGEHGLIELRKHLAWYVKGWPSAKKIRDALVRTSSVDEIKQILDSYDKSHE